jgi:hypothetical protein
LNGARRRIGLFLPDFHLRLFVRPHAWAVQLRVSNQRRNKNSSFLLISLISWWFIRVGICIFHMLLDLESYPISVRFLFFHPVVHQSTFTRKILD